MAIKKCFQARGLTNAASVGLLAVRLVMGSAFILHGLGKWGSPGGPMGWMGVEAPVPGVLQFLAAFSELGGGLALILGLLVPLAALGLTATMLVASGMHIFVKGDAFVGGGGGSYELPLLYLSLSLLFLLAGPGKFSLDAKLFGSR